jgi:sorting nexin-29
MDIHMAEPLVPEPSLVEVEIAIGKLKSCKSLGSDQIPAELIKGRGETLCSKIYKLNCSMWNKKELPQQWNESIIVPFHEKGDEVDCNNYQGISLLSPAYKILSNILLARLTPYVEVIGDHHVGSIIVDVLWIRFFYMQQITDKKWEYNGMVYQLFVDFKEA